LNKNNFDQLHIQPFGTAGQKKPAPVMKKLQICRNLQQMATKRNNLQKIEANVVGKNRQQVDTRFAKICLGWS
jgi:hypothetical protein